MRFRLPIAGSEAAEVRPAATGLMQHLLQARHVAAGAPGLATAARCHRLNPVEHDRYLAVRLAHRQAATRRAEFEITARVVQALEQGPRLT